jgi:hypothetical protein
MNACTNMNAACLMSVNCDAWFAPAAACAVLDAPALAVRLGGEIIGWIEFRTGFFARHIGCIRAAA